MMVDSFYLLVLAVDIEVHLIPMMFLLVRIFNKVQINMWSSKKYCIFVGIM